MVPSALAAPPPPQRGEVNDTGHLRQLPIATNLGLGRSFNCTIAIRPLDRPHAVSGPDPRCCLTKLVGTYPSVVIKLLMVNAFLEWRIGFQSALRCGHGPRRTGRQTGSIGKGMEYWELACHGLEK
jgi:hypothetical protein